MENCYRQKHCYWLEMHYKPFGGWAVPGSGGEWGRRGRYEVNLGPILVADLEGIEATGGEV